MKKASATAVIMTAYMLVAGTAFAQDIIKLPAGILPLNPSGLKQNIQNLRIERASVTDSIKSVQQNFKQESQTLRENTAASMKGATSSVERRGILQNAIETHKTMVEERRATSTALKARLSELARQHLGLINERFSIALDQFDNLAMRIQSRIEKLKTAGVDASSTETLLGAAQTAIAQAKADVQAVRDIVAQVSDTSDPKTVKAQIDTAVNKANASIKSAHSALVAAANDLVKIARVQSSQKQTSEPTSDATSTTH